MAGPPTIGLVLAGGRARRLGGHDKAFVELGGRPLLDWVCRAIRPQCDRLLIGANGDPARFAEFPLPVVPDVIAGQPGPLAGILSGLVWLRAQAPATRWLLTVPVDTPFLPADLVARLHAARAAAQRPLARACSGSRAHHVVGLWSVDLVDDLARALGEHDVRRVEAWAAAHRPAEAVFDTWPIDPFCNVNTPADLEAAEATLARKAR
ncbi:MAG: molybdenum cofactor guanylyltransferase MobA [Pseudomonadota bacterium]